MLYYIILYYIILYYIILYYIILYYTITHTVQKYKQHGYPLPVICYSWRLHQLQGWVILLGQL